jgi:hypothetical protein
MVYDIGQAGLIEMRVWRLDNIDGQRHNVATRGGIRHINELKGQEWRHLQRTIWQYSEIC